MILSETSTIGLRYYKAERCVLEREIIEVDTVWGKMPVKKVRRPGGKIELIPEHEACRKAADESGVPLREIYDFLTKTMAAVRHDP